MVELRIPRENANDDFVVITRVNVKVQVNLWYCTDGGLETPVLIYLTNVHPKRPVAKVEAYY